MVIFNKINNQMSAVENDGFFATQIAQQSAQEPGQQPQQAQSPEEPQKSESKPLIQDDSRSLKNMLIAFNCYDTKQKGIILVEEAKKIFLQKLIPTEQFETHLKIAMVSENGCVAFDQFLFLCALCEQSSNDGARKYDLCVSIDRRLVEFLRLLNNYRKKAEAQGNYAEAKKSKRKIEQIRERELERRRRYLNILHQRQLAQLQEKQKAHFIEFCGNWDNFMMDYEKTAADLIEKLQEKHEAELIQFENRKRQELAQRIKYSKQVLELEAKERSLVKLQEYEKAEYVRREIQQMKELEICKKQKTDEQSIEVLCANLRKQQMAAVNSLLQNIQKDRNEQLRQRKQDSEKLIIRNKNLITEINHRHTESLKKIYEALHNISLDSGARKKASSTATA